MTVSFGGYYVFWITIPAFGWLTLELSFFNQFFFFLTVNLLFFSCVGCVDGGCWNSKFFCRISNILKRVNYF